MEKSKIESSKIARRSLDRKRLELTKDNSINSTDSKPKAKHAKKEVKDPKKTVKSETVRGRSSSSASGSSSNSDSDGDSSSSSNSSHGPKSSQKSR